MTVDQQYQPPRIGSAPVYWQVPRYVDYELPFQRYRITTPFGCWETNVSKIFIGIYGEAAAVPMTAWGDLREHFPAALERVCKRFGRAEARRQITEAVAYERLF